MTDEDSLNECTEMRTRIINRFKSLSAAGSLAVNQGGVDINDIVTEFVKTGMKFSDAETFLRTCGFHVLDRPSNPSSTRIDKDAVYGFLKLTTPTLTFGFSSQVIISLYPRNSGDYSEIAKIYSSIDSTAL